ncbi:hypothetical protein INR49_015845 [Caranx melampygus]|nr:hypothetical protein INR49_015845 [Caranx melampygus]
MNFPCSVMSIQDIQCPVYDLDNNVAFIGMYQTMTKKGAITVQRKDFPSNSFYVVVVVKTEDEACGGPLRFYPLRPDELIDAGNRSKILDVVVSPAIDSKVYVMGMLFCLGIFFSFYLLTFLVACLENKRSEVLTGKTPASPYEYGSFADNGSTLSSEAVTDSATSTDNNYGYMDFISSKLNPSSLSAVMSLPLPPSERSLDSVGRSRQESLSSVEEDDYDTLDDINSDKNIVRTKKFLCVSDLARKDKRVLSKKYQIYFWNIATIAVFYALPVIQLVITYQTVVNVTGNQDICYYNFLCAHPLGALSAFNNILSNLGYVMLGLLFLLIVLKRDIVHNRALVRNDLNALECGIPKHFGLFYAMGTALMMEGLLSACYHVCPNYTNFQFGQHLVHVHDCWAVHVEAVSEETPGHQCKCLHCLCLPGCSHLLLCAWSGKCSHTHTHTYTHHHKAFVMLTVENKHITHGCVVCLQVFGKGNTVFWIIFSVIHILATLLLSTQLYYMGRWRLDSGVLRRMIYIVYTDSIRQCSGPMYIDRMVLLVMGNIVNWSLAAYGLIERPNDFASYLLAIAICNLLLYFAFYIIMKVCGVVRGSSVWRWCVFSSRQSCGDSLCISSSRVSAPGRSVPHTLTVVPQVKNFTDTLHNNILCVCVCVSQKTPAESREHNRDCILLSFFDDHDIWHFLSSIAMFGSFLVRSCPLDHGRRPRHRPERQDLRLLASSDRL